jgi:hypothetical protein
MPRQLPHPAGRRGALERFGESQRSCRVNSPRRTCPDRASRFITWHPANSYVPRTIDVTLPAEDGWIWACRTHRVPGCLPNRPI